MDIKALRRTLKWCAPLTASLFVSAVCIAADSGMTIESFPVPTQGASVASITAASTGDMWFVELAAHKLGKVSPTGTVTEISIPADSGHEAPVSIAKGADDRLWVSTEGNTIDAVTAGGVFEKFQMLSYNYDLTSPIALGGDSRMYFLEQDVNKIGAITTKGVASEYSIPTAYSGVSGITGGADQNLWFTEFRGNRIGRMTTAGVIVEFLLATEDSGPSAIAAGPDGNVWFVESRCPGCTVYDSGATEFIGRITPSGAITEFEVASTKGKSTFDPHDAIVAGPDGALWFTESDNNKVGRISIAGEISEFDLPADGAIRQSIALSTDGHLWVASTSGYHDHLYRITTATSFGITSGLTGSWYDPNQSGQGFSLEVLPGNVLLAYWYTFTPSGEATWINATGTINGATAKLDGYQIVGSGAKFPPYFDVKNVHPQFWGTLTFTFSDCGHGKVDWSTELPGYGSGTMNLTRLTQPMETSCP